MTEEHKSAYFEEDCDNAFIDWLGDKFEDHQDAFRAGYFAGAQAGLKQMQESIKEHQQETTFNSILKYTDGGQGC